MKKVFIVSLLLVLIATFPVYAGSIMRVQCDDNNPGAEVSINGKVVGECPIDVAVDAGTVMLRARIVVDEDHEKLFEKQFKVGDGVSQRVELVMSASRLTAEAELKRAETQRQKEAAAAAVRRRNEEAEAKSVLGAAEAGDIDAMKNMAEHYGAGVGVGKDPSAAAMWRDKAEATTAQIQLKAANAGDIDAMAGLASRYESGQGVAKDPSQAAFWRKKAEGAKREKLEAEEAVKRAEEAATRERIAREEALELATAARKAAEQSARDAQWRADNRAQRISNISFTEHIDKISRLSEDPTEFVTAIIALPMAIVSDLSEAPSKSSKINQIKNEAAVRPSTWGKPDSMIARASRQFMAGSSETENQLFVAAVK